MTIPKAMREIIGEGTSNAMDFAFDRMSIVEEEIESAMRASPRTAIRLYGCFKLLMPNDYLRTGETVYRLHCRELLGRVKRGEDVRPATDAELAAAFSAASTVAPPTQDFAAAYGLVFARLFPHRADLVEGLNREYVPGRAQEIVDEYRFKIGREIGRTPGMLTRDLTDAARKKIRRILRAGRR